jgi:hypothetical protein
MQLMSSRYNFDQLFPVGRSDDQLTKIRTLIGKQTNSFEIFQKILRSRPGHAIYTTTIG